jgi:hypothetical protein
LREVLPSLLQLLELRLEDRPRGIDRMPHGPVEPLRHRDRIQVLPRPRRQPTDGGAFMRGIGVFRLPDRLRHCRPGHAGEFGFGEARRQTGQHL